jgi:phosphoenolpyruvate carboxylase
MLQDMYNQWPFFRVTIDLVEMVFAKGDLGIASLYDKLLVSKELCPFGERLRSKYEETKGFLLKVISNCVETFRFGMFVHFFVAVSIF